LFQGFGLAQLERSYQCEGATRRLLAGFVLLFFHTFVCFFAGVGDGDVEKARRILNDMLEVRFSFHVFETEGFDLPCTA
jgi:hypothetical protein